MPAHPVAIERVKILGTANVVLTRFSDKKIKLENLPGNGFTPKQGRDVANALIRLVGYKPKPKALKAGKALYEGSVTCLSDILATWNAAKDHLKGAKIIYCNIDPEETTPAALLMQSKVTGNRRLRPIIEKLL